MGETLEENWVSEKLAYSSGEEEDATAAPVGQVKASEKKGKKRKGGQGDVHENNKKGKKDEAKGQRKIKGQRSVAKPEDGGLLATDAEQVSKTFWSFVTKANKDFTELQKNLGLPSSSFVACRNEAGWKDCSIIVKAGVSQWKKNVMEDSLTPRSPRVLVLSGSANRALVLIRELRSNLNCFVGKFFSRHIKLKETAAILGQNNGKAVPVGVGTPGRILKLIDLGHMNLDGTQLLIVDMSRDLKGYNLLEQKDIQKDANKLLNNHFVPALRRKNRMKIGIYL
jgi:hypothetical protein